MTPADLLHQIQADRVRLVLLPSGKLKITGTHAERWLPVLAQYEDALVDALRASAGPDTAGAGR